jgi:hypothetical protein
MITQHDKSSGVPELITSDLDSYAELMFKMATDHTWYESLRHKIEASRASSPMWNAKAYSDSFIDSLFQVLCPLHLYILAGFLCTQTHLILSPVIMGGGPFMSSYKNIYISKTSSVYRHGIYILKENNQNIFLLKTSLMTEKQFKQI